MTGEGVATQEKIPLPPVCEVSLAAAKGISDSLMTEMGHSTSVLYAAIADRNARMKPEARLGIGPALLVDPTRSGVVPRHLLQSGEVPKAVPGMTLEQAVMLWTVESKDEIPKLRVPKGEGPRLMAVADALQMRGGGPTIFAREEVALVPHTEKTLVKIDGAANNANWERVATALAYADERGYKRPIVATVDVTRELGVKERAAVASFAPKAQNEMELFIDSARNKHGFVLDQDATSYGGTRYLPDGSPYVTMILEREDREPVRLIVLAPRRDWENGVFNGYQTLIKYGSQLPGLDADEASDRAGFVFDGTDMVTVTGTHYGPMSVMNNLRATHELRARLGSYHVIGDNQKARTEDAHLYEVGFTWDAIRKAMGQPALREALLRGVN